MPRSRNLSKNHRKMPFLEQKLKKPCPGTFSTGCPNKNATFYFWPNYQLSEKWLFRMTNGPITSLCFYHSCVIKIWDNWDKNPLFDWLSQKRPFFRRKKSTETNVKPPYDIRDPRNWTLWVICYLNYRLASKFGTIGTKIHFLTDCPKKDPFLGGKSPRKPTSNHRMTSETPVIGLYGSFVT